MSMKVSDELDYSVTEVIHPRYQFTRILPYGGSSSVSNIPINSGIESTIQLPVKVMNFYHSVLPFTFTPAAAGANLTNVMFNDTIGIMNILELLSPAGAVLARIYDVGNYLRMVSKKETQLQNFLTNDSFNGLTRINADAAVNQKPTANADTVSVSHTEPQYILPGEVAGNTATPVLQYELRLSAFKNTIFALNKDLYFGQLMTLRIVWGPMVKAGFIATAANPVAPVTGAAPIAAAGNITNLSLYLAIETRRELSDQLTKSVLTNGFKMYIPFVTRVKTSIAQSTSQSVSIPIDRGMGLRLRKIIHSVFNGTESKNNTYNNQNYAAGSYVGAANGDKVVSYYTQVNGVPLQQNPIICANWDDYMYNRDQLDGSVIQDRYMYSYNWFHCDDFTQEQSPSDQKAHSAANFDIMGIDLSASAVKWDFYATTSNNAFVHYTYIVTTKPLVISPTGSISCE